VMHYHHALVKNRCEGTGSGSGNNPDFSLIYYLKQALGVIPGQSAEVNG